MMEPTVRTSVIFKKRPRVFSFTSKKTLKSGCLSLLTIRSFGARDGLGLTVRVWLGFGYDSTEAVPVSIHVVTENLTPVNDTKISSHTLIVTLVFIRLIRSSRQLSQPKVNENEHGSTCQTETYTAVFR
eukprot:sb/3475229/